MHHLPRLALLVAATTGALLFGASAAAGQNITVTNEATGVPCPAVSPADSSEFPPDSTIAGGCAIHIVNTEGLVVLTAHVFGVESTDFVCTHEYTARIGGDGEGYFTDVELSGAACPRRPCGTAAAAPEAWEIHAEETTSTSARLELHLCIESAGGSGRQTCHLFIPLREELAGSHGYELGTASGAEARTEIGCEGFSGFRAEFSGHWKTEISALELVHGI